MDQTASPTLRTQSSSGSTCHAVSGNASLRLKVISYNILADCYLNPQWYSHIDPRCLPWDARRRALVSRIKSHDADVVCLQEVEAPAYSYLSEHLAGAGYAGVYARKAQGKPDGCATFFRSQSYPCASSRVFYYNDGIGVPNSGHLALLASFNLGSRPVKVANTHLKWDAPDKSNQDHVGCRQASEMLRIISECSTPPLAWIVCGDFNATPDSPVIQQFQTMGFLDAHINRPQPTANPHRRAKRIDFIFHGANLRATPQSIPQIDDLTPLPSASEPSDHLPVAAEFEPREASIQAPGFIAAKMSR